MTDVVGTIDTSADTSASAPWVVPSAIPSGLLSACRYLAARYRGIFSPETVLRTVYESYQLFVTTSGRTMDTLPGAVAHATRFAADWLADAAYGGVANNTVGGSSQMSWQMSRPPRVLFVCLHETGRAQMAAALLRRRAGGRVSARSAGPVAGRAIQPAVVAAMAELGIGISMEYPEPLLDDVVRAADVVVTMGCGDYCPVYLGKRYLDWPIPSAPGSRLGAVRVVRDQIEVYVERLLDEMTRRPPSHGERVRMQHPGGLRGQRNWNN